jgi:hypothetical protein
MLITFRSKPSADFIMYKDHARRILESLNKNVDMGVFVPEEIPHAIEVIETAISESRAHPISEEVVRDVQAHHNEDGNDVEHEKADHVSLSSRMFPLLEMLRAANQAQCEVVWGV